jgi:hypothetical protein
MVFWLIPFHLGYKIGFKFFLLSYKINQDRAKIHVYIVFKRILLIHRENISLKDNTKMKFVVCCS